MGRILLQALRMSLMKVVVSGRTLVLHVTCLNQVMSDLSVKGKLFCLKKMCLCPDGVVMSGRELGAR